MPYVQVPDPLLNADKPIRSTDIKQMRDNQDYFNTAIAQLTPNNAITEHFSRTRFYTSNIICVASGATFTYTRDYSDDLVFAAAGGGAGTYAEWDEVMGATGTNDDHFVTATAVGTTQLIGSTGFYFDNRTKPIVFQLRMRVRNYGDWTNFFFGLMGNIPTAASATRPTYGLFCEPGSAGGKWRFVARNGGGGALETVGSDFDRPATDSWYTMEIEFTDDPSDQAICSTDGVTRETLTTDLPTGAVLYPVLHLVGTVDNAKYNLDYINAYASGGLGDAT